MDILEHFEQLEKLVAGGRVPGTSRCLVNIDKLNESMAAIKASLPTEMEDAQSIVRQKESVIKQAELEARRIRAYADEEATTIRETAEERAKAATESAEQQARRMIDVTEVHRAAEIRAAEIVAEADAEAQTRLDNAEVQIAHLKKQAETEAESRKRDADDYAREVLFNLEQRVAETLGQVRMGIDVLDADAVSVG